MNGYSFLLQVFYTLRTAASLRVLPTHLTCRYLIISSGSVMIDVVTYLSSNINVPTDSLFGDYCHGLRDVCCELVSKHLPESNLYRWFCGLTTNKRSTVVLTKAIEWLLRFEPWNTDRIIPRLISMNETCVTFKDYFSEIPSWLQRGHTQQDRERECSGKIFEHRVKSRRIRTFNRHSGRPGLVLCTRRGVYFSIQVGSCHNVQEDGETRTCTGAQRLTL